ncbi:MAG: YadA C-terminal domain-containing protein, partial [Sedimentisphaerales bacterium]|nr:YadA C-terminal domain-containing protein [Sedimentisphaerales bacterium]
TSSRFVSADGTQSIAVSNSGTAITAGSGHTLNVTGTTTTINGTAAIYSGDTSGNELIVDSASARLANSTNTNSIAVNSTQTTVTGTTAINGNTTITSTNGSHALSVTNSNTLIEGGAVIYSGDGTNNSISVSGNTNNNTLVVGDTQTGNVGINSFNYGTEVTGGMLIEGDLGVNGSIYSLNPTASATVNVANNGMTITGAENTVVLQADNDALDTNFRSALTMVPTSTSLLVNTDTGESHGIEITQSSTVISGGTSTTTLTLDDNGATFADEDTGAPIKVTGVANGTGTYDAVNYGQFTSELGRLDDRIDDSYSGIASVAAIAAVPSPVSGKNLSVGLGFGNFKSESAIALGAKALLGRKKDVTITAGLGYSGSNTTLSAGLGWSF